MKERKQNLHTHSRFCDGKDTPEELVLKALEKGFTSLGFSSHIGAPNVKVWGAVEDLAGYKAEIERLKIKYKEKIRLFLGAEFDYYTEEEPSQFDYVIGSVHQTEINGETVYFDHDMELAKKQLLEHFGGDWKAYIKEYYQKVCELPKRFSFNVVGHFDVISKFCIKGRLFDDQDEFYKKTALEALHTVAESKKIFEINTGVMARGYRANPYPAAFLLKELKTLGGEVVFGSDCHNKELLDYGFEEAKAILRSVGFTHTLYFNGKNFEENSL